MPKSITEIMSKGVSFITEFNDSYYIRPKGNENEYYDNTLWVIDKKTNEIRYMDYTEYIIDIKDKAIDVDPKVFEKAS